MASNLLLAAISLLTLVLPNYSTTTVGPVYSSGCSGVEASRFNSTASRI